MHISINEEDLPMNDTRAQMKRIRDTHEKEDTGAKKIAKTVRVHVNDWKMAENAKRMKVKNTNNSLKNRKSEDVFNKIDEREGMSQQKKKFILLLKIIHRFLQILMKNHPQSIICIPTVLAATSFTIEILVDTYKNICFPLFHSLQLDFRQMIKLVFLYF